MPKSYAYNSGLSWPDYLKVNEIRGVGDDVRQLRYELSSSNRKLIATHEELQREHIAAIKSIGDAVSSGFEGLSLDMQAISSGIEELTSVFEWGFSELLVGIGHIKDSLTELVRLAKTPAQTWAYEQFEIARDAFRQGLYEEALEYLDRSIDGYGDNTGYKLEYRFHFLLGTIRMGGFQNNSQSIIDLPKAEQAFLAAAKYARHDQPKESARAFLAAGWASYCQGNMLGAEQFTKDAISLFPDLGEAHFQLAKILMHCQKRHNALQPLKTAILLDRNYAIKASSDDDFKRYNEEVNKLIHALHKEAQERAESALLTLDEEARQLEALGVGEFSCSRYVDFGPLRRLAVTAKCAASNNTYFGYLDALNHVENAQEELSNSKRQFLNSAMGDVRGRISRVDSAIREVKNFSVADKWWWLIAIGIIASFILSVSQCNHMIDANSRQAQIRKQAFNNMYNDLRRKGYGDPTRLTWDQVKPYGYTPQNMPPADVGSAFGAWFGTLLVSVVIIYIAVKVANEAQKKSKLTELEREKLRLDGIDEELRQLENNA